MTKYKSLRKRWLLNTVGVVCVLGLACVFAVTAVFAAYYYSSMESDLRYRARTSTEFFSDYLNQSYNQYYQSCITYAKTFEDKNSLELQFINAEGRIVASSYGSWAGPSPTTSDITDAMKTRDIVPYFGKNPQTGERILAVSSPMIYSNGEVIGVMRYVTSARLLEQQVLRIGSISLVALLVIIAVVLFSSNYYIHSILVPLRAVIDKAQKITNGSYGIKSKSSTTTNSVN